MTSPFPNPYPTLLGDNPALGSALETAISEALSNFPSIQNPFRAAISIGAIDESASPPDFSHGGAHFGDTVYSASLLKVAAMYAAFELRRSANALAADLGVSSSAQLFARLNSDFQDAIDNSVPLIRQQPDITPAMRRPKYEQIFATIPVAGGGLAMTFTGSFQTNMRNMIINSNNNAAAACVQALGYSWINGTLKAGGFFFEPAQSGVWLAGTFTGVQPPVRIPSVNDGPAAQAATCFDLANMYAHIFQGTLVDAASSSDMLAMLAVTAATSPDPSFMDFTRRHGLPPRSFTVTHTKIGLGPLKSGTMVASEGSIVEHGDSGRKFVVVWQNSFNDDDSLFAIGAVVERAIELFLSSP